MAGDSLHVVFGAGPVGMAIADELIARGERVRLVNRSGRIDEAGVEVVGGDAKDPAFAREAAAGASVVYDALNAPYHRWPEEFPSLQRGVVEGAARVGAKLVVMENVYMYGPTGGAPLTEDLPYRARGRKGAVRARMSEELIAAHREGRVRVAIGRSSDFFGPRVTESSAGARLFEAAIAGRRAQVLGDPSQPHTYTYIRDIGRALVILGERDEALGRAWHIPSPAPVTTRELVEMICAQAGSRPRLLAASPLMLRALGLFSPTLRELRETLYQFREPFVVDASRFIAAFGDISTPLPEAIRDTVAWYRARGSSAPSARIS